MLLASLHSVEPLMLFPPLPTFVHNVLYILNVKTCDCTAPDSSCSSSPSVSERVDAVLVVMMMMMMMHQVIAVQIHMGVRSDPADLRTRSVNLVEPRKLNQLEETYRY